VKILLIYASWGWGHKKAALAVEEVLRARGIDAQSRDLLEFLPASLSFIYSSSYSLIITQWRGLWRWIYETTDRTGNGYHPYNSLWQSWQFRKLYHYLSESDFTHIVSTHFLTSALLAGWREEHGWSQKIFSVITDFTAHRYWKKPGLDHYFVPTEEVAAQLVLADLPPNKISTTGIPISTVFHSETGREEIRKELGCSPEEKLMLVLTSGYNASRTRSLLEELKTIEGRFLVSAGKDAPKEAWVKELCGKDDRFTVFGISTRIPEFMRASDLLISKPGGITTSEALASGLPLVLLTPIPGQEEGNARFLFNSRIAIWPKEKKGELREALSELLSERGRLREMSSAARRFGKPQAANSIADAVLSL
jgi:processive 1,2-diacylglycerol beta-glucosyltransferase